MPATDRRATTDDLTRVRVLGLDFIDAADVGIVADALLAHRPRRRGDGPAPVLVTPNVDQMVKIDRGFDQVASDLVRSAQYVLADGQPIVWASRLLGRPLATRLPGSSLVEALWPRLVAAKVPVLVVASSEEIAGRVAADHPQAVVQVAPMLRAEQPAAVTAFADACLAAVDVERVRFVFVGLGFPSRERVIAELLERWPAAAPMPVFGAIGASFEMLYGLRRRAPNWVQRWGLEWLFRFVQEPRRLFRRYFVEDVAFFPLVWRAWRAQRSR